MDFDALRHAADPSQLAPPEPLRSLDRATVLAAHCQLVQQERALDQAGQFRTRRLVVGGPSKAWSSAALESLKRANLVDSALRTDHSNKGSALVFRIISEAVRTSGVQFVVEDCEGEVAPVQLYNVQPKWSASQLNAIYRIGSCWALKDPTIRSSSRGFLIRVDSPPDLVRLWPSHHWLRTAFLSPPPIQIAQLSSLDHKAKGNACLAQSRPLDALEHYSLALDALDPATDPAPALRATLLSNRAAVHLKLGSPGCALRDCEAALGQAGVTDALRGKVLYRAGLACYEMERYGAAAGHLDEVAELAPGDPAAGALYKRVASRMKEELSGMYDWRALYSQSVAGAAIDAASYVSPAASVAEVEGKHRALVATAPLEPGELLFVQRPLASGRADKAGLSVVAGANLWTDSLDPPGVGHVVADLLERWVDREDQRDEIGRLWAGESKRWLNGCDGEAGVDVTRLEGIATFNCFHPESLADTASSDRDAEADSNVYAPSALYLLPSYMNHACVGNVSYSFLGDVIFARARLAIAPGDELVDSYVDGSDELDARRPKLRKHGFVCACVLCAMDELDGLVRRRRRFELGEEVDQLADRVRQLPEASAARHIGTIRRLVGALEECHHPTRSQLRPAVYPARRLLAQTLSDCGQHAEAIAEEVEALKALGAQFGGDDLAGLKLVAVPRAGDANAVLSALFVAKQWNELGNNQASGHWVGVARRIERGQAGEELFELRYGEWARRHRVKLEL